MTIHQSKGMEFPIVIVDSLNGTPRSSGNHLLEEIENKYFHRKFMVNLDYLFRSSYMSV